jgi:hypothetical protein
MRCSIPIMGVLLAAWVVITSESATSGPIRATDEEAAQVWGGTPCTGTLFTFDDFCDAGCSYPGGCYNVNNRTGTHNGCINVNRLDGCTGGCGTVYTQINCL